MRAVVDSSCINHLFRGRATRKTRQRAARPARPSDIPQISEDPISRCIASGNFLVVLDRDLALLDEWRRTNGPELVNAIYEKWYNAQGVAFVNATKLHVHVRKRMRQLGFEDTGDKLIVRIANSDTDRNIVSEDGDFWDPADKKQKGKPGAEVARLLSNELNITLHTLGQLCTALQISLHA